MNPNPENKHNKMVQFITTAVLVLILASVIGGYIMYGMRAAQTVEPVVEEAPSVVDEGSVDREAVMRALNQEPSAMSPEDRAVIIEDLQVQAVPNISPEAEMAAEAERQKIIDALNQ
jgi:hypothetical protein